MSDHERILTNHIIHATIGRFIEVWPDATIVELAAAMPYILAEAHTLRNADLPTRQLALRIVKLLWDNQFIPPWQDIYVDAPAVAA